MKKNKILVGLLVLTSMNAMAEGADKGGNGGGAHLCFTDGSRTVEKSIVTYDLWEGARLHTNWTFKPASESETKKEIEARVMEKIQKTQPVLAYLMQNVLIKLEEPNFVNDSADVELKEIQDVGKLLVGKNCKYLQMVNWLDVDDRYPGSPETVLRDESHYKGSGSAVDIYTSGIVRMNDFNQAALDIHEAAYKAYRDNMPGEYKLYGSNKVRELVAEAFSDQLITTRLISDQTDTTGMISFESDGTEVHTFMRSQFISQSPAEASFSWAVKGTGSVKDSTYPNVGPMDHSGYVGWSWRLDSPIKISLVGDLTLELFYSGIQVGFVKKYISSAPAVEIRILK